MVLGKKVVVSSCLYAIACTATSSSFVIGRRPLRCGRYLRSDPTGSSNFVDEDAVHPDDVVAVDKDDPRKPTPTTVADNNHAIQVHDDGKPTRRDALGTLTASLLAVAVPPKSFVGITTAWFFPHRAAWATYMPAIRPLAYRVDSTIPPTLLSISPREGEGVLAAIGRGSGTDKDAVIVDTINLNNMLNKAVFGAIDSVSSFTGGGNDPTKKKNNNNNWEATFCSLAMPTTTQSRDVNLAVQILQSIMKARKTGQSTGLGLYFCPYSTQPLLDQYVSGELDDVQLQQGLVNAGVSLGTQELYGPILQWGRKQATSSSTKSLDFIAMAPEVTDMITVRSQGLQNVNPTRRSQYVVDAPGFIALPQDPRFKLYADRSLAKDFLPSTSSSSSSGDSSSSSSFANFFSERILAHEAGATAVAQYAIRQGPGTLVVLLAPIADLRFLGGINGRIPRVCQAIKTRQQEQQRSQRNEETKEPSTTVVTDANAITTILLNPTAADTLSKTRQLRLEIGTAPETLDYQTKIADYLWFDESPKVNLIPRLMN